VIRIETAQPISTVAEFQSRHSQLPIMQAEENLRDALAAANQTIDALGQALAASKARIDALLGPGGGNDLGASKISPLSTPAAPEEHTRIDSVVELGDETITALVHLARNEFQHGRFESAGAIARQILQRVPNESQSQHLASLVGPLERPDGPPPQQRAHHDLALGEAYRLLGQSEAAEKSYRSALTLIPDFPDAHAGLAMLRMPGDNYRSWLQRFYQLLKPKTVIEIGVFQSASLACVPPPAIALGIDPSPCVIYPVQTETHLFAETSDEFFKQRKVPELLGDQLLSIGFIDGLHLFEQALKDFMHLELYCGPRSMILFHDTVPLDELTQRRTPEVHFSTGDVWKTILCLKHYRPDLDIFTIATQPTGLTVVTRLDPSSRVLQEAYDSAVQRFIDIPFETIESTMATELNIIPNDWEAVESRLKSSGII
jgi:tetratricopeptide (TPR) repeat protein